MRVPVSVRDSCLSLRTCIGGWVILATGAVSIGLAGESADAVSYPIGYRQWPHVKSGLINPGHPFHARFGGIHHIYANALAMTGYRRGNFPDGSILVFDLLEVRTNAGTTDQGPRRHVDVMVKDNARFAGTGGWGYEEFLPSDLSRPTLSPGDKATCAACHASRRDHDAVFSEYQE